MSDLVWTPHVSQGRSDFLGARVGQHNEYTIRQWLPTSEFGAVGHVWVATRDDGHLAVVKTPKDPRSDGWKKELRGATFALSVTHENLMSVLYVGQQQCPIFGANNHPLGTPNAVFSYIIIEHCTQLDMFSYCEKQPFSHNLARHFFIQLVKGIDALHTHAGAHRDLKPDNLLLSRLLTLKIGDFGFAREIEASQDYTLGCGTAIYNSPEMQQRAQGHSNDVDPKAQDVWMMGCCLFILLTNTFPFEGEPAREQMFQLLDDPTAPFPPTNNRYWRGHVNLRGGKRPFDLLQRFLNEPNRAPGTGVVDLINRMWDRDYHRRITTQQILQHPWITSNPDGSPVVPYDMAGAVLDVARGNAPQPGSLLAEMCSKVAGNTVIDMLRRDNRAYL